MGDLLHSSTPPLWRAAVRRAGQLLAPSWPDGGRPDALGTLSLLLYTLAHDRGVEPEALPVGAVREALADDPDAVRDGTTQVMWRAMEETGHPFSPDDAVRRIARRLLPMRQPDDGTMLEGTEKPNPSLMACCTPWLRTHLDTVNVIGLPPAPEPTPPISVKVTGQVQLVTAHSSILLKCSTCSMDAGGVLAVDGDEATYRCRRGHATTDPRLGTDHVRRAVEIAAPSRGRVRGMLLVARAELPPDTDPTRVCIWHPNGPPPARPVLRYMRHLARALQAR